MAAQQLPEELWDIDRLANYLGVGKRFVYRLTSEKRIRFVRIGGALRFRPEDVAAYLDAETVTPEPAPAPAPRRRGRPRATSTREQQKVG